MHLRKMLHTELSLQLFSFFILRQSLTEVCQTGLKLETLLPQPPPYCKLLGLQACASASGSSLPGQGQEAVTPNVWADVIGQFGTSLMTISQFVWPWEDTLEKS